MGNRARHRSSRDSPCSKHSIVMPLLIEPFVFNAPRKSVVIRIVNDTHVLEVFFWKSFELELNAPIRKPAEGIIEKSINGAGENQFAIGNVTHHVQVVPSAQQR